MIFNKLKMKSSFVLISLFDDINNRDNDIIKLKKLFHSIYYPLDSLEIVKKENSNLKSFINSGLVKSKSKNNSLLQKNFLFICSILLVMHSL